MKHSFTAGIQKEVRETSLITYCFVALSFTAPKYGARLTTKNIISQIFQTEFPVNIKL